MTATRSVVLSGARLDGLELLLGGMLGESHGYCLPGEGPTGWAIAPTLEVGVAVAPGERLELEDPDHTPLAALDVDRIREARDGAWWVAGTLTPMHPPEHGHARELRATAGTDLAEHTVALFAGRIRAADVLSAARLADRGGLDLVYVGASDAAETARGLRDLEDGAALLPGARVLFVPVVDLGVHDDVASLVVRRLGAADPLDFRRESAATSGAVVLFTGLSGAGKSTLARGLVEHLRTHTAQPAVLLDGDDVRREISGELGFRPEDRDRNLQRIAWVAARVAEVGGVAVCAPIAPFASSRAAMRSKVEPRSPFLVVYVSTPLAVAELRDRKGLYAKARAGLISDFTGIDSPYEAPADADLVLDTSVTRVEVCVTEVVRLLGQRGVLPVGSLMAAGGGEREWA